MKLPLLLLAALPALSAADLAPVRRDVPYAVDAAPRQILDIYAPSGARDLPVVFWIHGGGWQSGDKTLVQEKPRAFTARGFVFVAINHRLLPAVDMTALTDDVARALGWVHANIAAHGGDPRRIFVMGHSSGAQLAALLCTDERRLRAHGVPFSALRGCVPVDGDTYDLPAIITTAETRRRAHGQPEPKSTHRAKFGTEEQHRDFSAVTHIAPGKGIPPFLILHVAEHPDNSAQAQRLGAVLRAAGVPVKVFGARETNHSRINNELGLPQDTCTRELGAFVDAHHGATR
jgi:acetyl esterase/lipase